MSDIQLGDKVRCKLSGFVGVAVARTEFINGCVQYNVLPKVKKTNEVIEDVSIDEGSLEVISKKTKPKKKKENGGPMRKAISARGY